MKKVLVACDLDNTLIHSYKHRGAEDVCIEHIREKEQGFIHPEALEKLLLLKAKTQLVPVTTRSVEQYLRIRWEQAGAPEYAITTNGAILLKNGEIDEEWAEESRRILERYKEELVQVLAALEEEGLYIRCRNVDGMYVFAYCREGVDAGVQVEKYRGVTSLTVIASGKKIYFLPNEFNKGSALQRWKKRFMPEYVIAAGDSEIDLPMLEEADLAYVKEGIFDRLSGKIPRLFTNEINLLDSILEEISFPE